MATVSDLVATLATRLGEPVAAVRQKVRHLQDNNLLPVASGRAVPNIEPEHVVLAMLAVLGADAVKDATRVAARLAEMTQDGRAVVACPPGLDAEVNAPARMTLLSFLSLVVADLMKPSGTPAAVRFGHVDATYELCLSWPEFHAVVPTFDPDDLSQSTGPAHFWFGEAGNPTSHWRGHVRKAVTVAGFALSGIAFDLASASGSRGGAQ
jgi:hypothetical protein